MIHRIEKRIELIGSLDEVQRARLIEIADRCPVHRTLTSRIEIRSALVSARNDFRPRVWRFPLSQQPNER